MRYDLVNKIGSGGMAEVFRAVAHGPGGFRRPSVIKRILPHIAQDPTFVQMFLDEAKISALLSHPNIVQVFEFGQVGGVYFIAMEHVHGKDLSMLMSRLWQLGTGAEPTVAAHIALQCCRGLDYAHGITDAEGKPLDIVHRDVTPSNIMVGMDGVVKLLDFGIAHATDDTRESHTNAGVLKGKFAYLAPEQIQRRDVDRRSDIFSLGIVLHELLAGRRLFRGETDLETLRMVTEMPISLPSAGNPAIPAGLDRIVMSALERDPLRRYQSAADMASDLEDLLVRDATREVARFMKKLTGEGSGAASVSVEPSPSPAPPADEVLTMAVDPAVTMMVEVAEADVILAVDQNEFARAPHTVAADPGQVRQSPPVAVVPDALPPAPVPERAPPAAPPAAGRSEPQGIPASQTWVTMARGPRRFPLAAGGLLVLAVAAYFAGRYHAGAPAPAGAALAAQEPDTVFVSMDSAPQGAMVQGDPAAPPLGETPLILELPRSRQPRTFTLSKDGYRTAVVKVIPNQDKPTLVPLATPVPQMQDKAARAAVRPRPPAPGAGPAYLISDL